MRSLRLIVHDISWYFLCELDWRWCCRWRSSGCLAENPLVGVSATYSIASSTLWQPHLLYLIWDEDGSKKSLLKETMCNEVRLVLSMQFFTQYFSAFTTRATRAYIYLATGAVGIQRVEVWYKQQDVSLIATLHYTARMTQVTWRCELVCLWSSSLFGLPRGLWRPRLAECR